MSVPKAIILSEMMRGKSFELVNDVYTIGRTEDNDICIPDGTLSSKHCQLIRENDTFKVVDQGSTNGTRINGERIMEEYLKSSDILQVGGIEILFDSEDSSQKSTNTTKTNINLDMNGTFNDLSNMKNINPIKTTKIDDTETKSKAGFAIVIGVLFVIVLVLLYFVYVKITKG